MKKNKISKDFLMSYLLGKLDPKKHEQLEEQYFLDDEIFSRLLTVHDELVRKYQMDQLSQKDRELFKKKYLRSRRGSEKLEFEKMLMENISKIKKKSSIREKTSLVIYNAWEWLRGRISVPIWRLATVGATIAFVALLVRFWFMQPTPYPSPLVADVRFIYRSTGFGLVQKEERLRTRAPESFVLSDIVLTEHDVYAIQIQPESTIFLYVFQWDESSNMSVLFPNPEYADFTNPLMRGKAYRFPPTPNWLSLDHTPGMETIGFGATVRQWQAMEQSIDLFNQGTKQDKMNAIGEIIHLIQKAKEDTTGMFYGERFSFKHVLEGDKK